MIGSDMFADMQPMPEDTTIQLPITFDYTGGAQESMKSKVITSVVLVAIMLFIDIACLFASEVDIVTKLCVVTVVTLAVTYFLRFITFKERMYSDAYETLAETNFNPGTETFWQIYDVSNVHPYICHYSNKTKGIFVRLEKDVIVGKPDDILYRHHEGIADAYKKAGGYNLNICHIDYMDNVGNDVRMKSLWRNLEYCENKSLKRMLESVYANLQYRMSNVYTSYDTYVFKGNKRPDELWYEVKDIIESFMCANYITYKVLDIHKLRSTAIALFNLEEFSAKEACNRVLNQEKYRGLVPIKIIHDDGTEDRINLTTEEKRIEAEEKARQEKERQKQAKASKKNNKKKGTEKPQEEVLEEPQATEQNNDNVDFF